jgi:5-methyltetrahydrofolate--homocysteine methyltransferase
VINLGIKQPITTIIEAANQNKANAIGMSGLLVKSTVVMRENLEEMRKQGLDIPVMLGGAALTRQYVETDCLAAYGGSRVAYARDAFDGLGLMDKIMTGSFDQLVESAAAKAKSKPANTRRAAMRVVPQDGGASPDAAATPGTARPIDYEELKLRKAELLRGVPVPKPPFYGASLIEKVPLKTLVSYLNERMLYQFHWGYRKEGRKLDEYLAWARKELRPITTRLLKQAAEEGILEAKAAYGYWKCAAEGNDVILFDESGAHEVARFAFPRQNKPGGLCIADFFRDVSSNERDVIGLQVVTMGHAASETARRWFAENRYQDYLYLHGLGVEMTEALAEYVHKRVRAELGFAGEDARDVDALLAQGYRGSRYSFGYPACPNLADQRQLLGLLGADRIGVGLSDGDMLEPEQSTSAIVVHHPQAKYFSV